MSDIECIENRADAACCVNPGCGNRFDQACEGFNGECDACAALTADHFTGAHRGFEVECLSCWAEEPAEADRSLAIAA
ncbi:MAG: hypothetical protein QOI26_1043 [Pseudonocardiales bacterium]|jgi:hypothetical protein|nr:hypothetical protein [Pseudonocardiales bacterium]